MVALTEAARFRRNVEHDNPNQQPGQQQQNNPRPGQHTAAQKPGQQQQGPQSGSSRDRAAAGRQDAEQRTSDDHLGRDRVSGGPPNGGVRSLDRVWDQRGTGFSRFLLAGWPMLTAWPPPRFPLFHLYGDPPDDQAFDFIHVETIASRSSIHDWTIRAHRHRNLFQILLIERGGGEMTYEAATIAFEAPCRHPGAGDHRARLPLPPEVTDGWVVSFTEDVAEALGDRSGEALARLKALAADPVVPLATSEREGGCRSSAPSCTRKRFLGARGLSGSPCADCSR